MKAPKDGGPHVRFLTLTMLCFLFCGGQGGTGLAAGTFPPPQAVSLAVPIYFNGGEKGMVQMLITPDTRV